LNVSYEPLCPDEPHWFTQFFTARLPDVDEAWLKETLYADYKIEVPVFRWNGHTHLRVSFQGYNNQEDADVLVGALEHLFS